MLAHACAGDARRRTHLCGLLPRLLLALRLLLRAEDLPALRVALDDAALAFAFALTLLLQRGLHVLREADVPDDGHEAFPAEDSPEDLLGVDEAAVGRALLGPELVVLAPEGGVGEGLIRDGDLFEALLGVWVVWVLIRVELDRQSTCGELVLMREGGESEGYG